MKVWARVGMELDIDIKDIQDEQKVIEAIKAGRINGEVYFPQEADENDELYAALRSMGNNNVCALDVVSDVKPLSSIQSECVCFNANDYTTHQLLEMEFQNVPNSTHKENLITEALQLVEECGYSVGEAANEVKVSVELTGLPQLTSLKSNFLTFVGDWINGQDCRTGENRGDGTVTYNQDGLYLYEFKTREDAFKYLFDDDRSVPFAIAAYYKEASEYNGEETFGEWEFHNGFNPLWLDSKGA